MAKHRIWLNIENESHTLCIQNEMKEVDGELGEKTNKTFLLKNLREIDQLFALGLHMRGTIKYVI